MMLLIIFVLDKSATTGITLSEHCNIGMCCFNYFFLLILLLYINPFSIYFFSFLWLLLCKSFKGQVIHCRSKNSGLFLKEHWDKSVTTSQRGTWITLSSQPLPSTRFSLTSQVRPFLEISKDGDSPFSSVTTSSSALNRHCPKKLLKVLTWFLLNITTFPLQLCITSG